MNFDFFPKQIDLHGLRTSEAISTVLNALYELENDSPNQNYLDIVVGVGTGALRLSVEELLDNENYRYEFTNSNKSSIRVYKK
ncbi:Smr/MutS family protein [Metamycoplasma equirhinis]|uniref:Smr/MutS family protein n=1 Tax=Metamycoplasma equirhinis TaxID=92402 RepID=UPI0035939EF9